MQNPDKDSTVKTRRSSINPALSPDLMERILASDNMKRAWQQVKRNHGTHGVDGMTLDEFPQYARLHWNSIRQALRDGTYKPSPVRRVEIPKPKGGKRLLGIPTVIDRVIQQAIAQCLEPIFDPAFSESSFGFRPKRSAHQAVKQVREQINRGYHIAVEVDLEKFFDEVDHDVLMARVALKVQDKAVLKLIGKYLRAGVVGNKEVEPTNKGVPQGGNISPLLSNIVLDDLDRELERRKHKFTRYADDFCILVKSKRAGERVKRSITRFLEKQLKLKVNNDKSKVGKANKTEFLGFTFPGKTIRWTDAALFEFKHRIRKLTGRSSGVSIDSRVEALNYYISGWMNYFVLSKYYTPIPALDHWIRRRLRMCLWKQWRLARTKVRELVKLGTFLNSAIQCAMSRKSYWRLSKTLATHSGMTNFWLHHNLGLVSLKSIWVRFHYPS